MVDGEEGEQLAPRGRTQIARTRPRQAPIVQKFGERFLIGRRTEVFLLFFSPPPCSRS